MEAEEKSFSNEEINISRKSLLLLAIVTEGSVCISAYAMAWFFDINIYNISVDFWKELFYGTLLAIPPALFFSYAISKKAEGVKYVKHLREIALLYLKPIFSKCTNLDIFFISLLAGFSEELLFRGVLQIKFGIVVASLIFGLLHFVSPIYFITATVMGFYIGYLFSYYDSLLVPIQVHFTYDYILLMYLKYYLDDSKEQLQ